MKPCLLFMLLLMFAACKKDIPNPVSDAQPSTPGQAFEEFWNDMNVNYVYWDIDTTNWGAVYQQYKPLFSGLRLNDTADMVRAVGYMRKITDGLVDHHFSITFTNNVVRDSTIVPAYDQWRGEPSFHFSNSYLGSDKSYLDSGYLFGADYTSVPGSTLNALSGTIHRNILFFGFNQFLLSDSYSSSVDNPVKPVLDYFFGRLANPSGLKAVLLDLRDNPGGDANDLNFLVGQFIGQPTVVGYTRNKTGNGRLDYSPWVAVRISSQTGAHAVSLPLYILADKYSQSMAEITTMALRALPNCRVVGETTFGATGPFGENALYDDGPFEVPGFLSVTTSSVEFKDVDGKIYEGVGFPPDYPVAYDVNALSTGHDPQMEKVLSLVQ